MGGKATFDVWGTFSGEAIRRDNIFGDVMDTDMLVGALQRGRAAKGA